jgi:hypothetical protein
MHRIIAVLILCVGTGAVARAQRGPSFVNGRSNSGEELACDLPDHEQFANVGSRLDGAGMCVFTSFEMACRWHGLEEMRGFRDWCAARYPGGGYPEKLDQLVRAYCKAKGIKPPLYVQYEGPVPGPLLQACDQTGRLACMTYGYSPRYGNGTIAHMTCCPKYSGRFGVCLDNNFIGSDHYEWMSRDELVKRIKWPNGRAWLVVLLAPSPPPVPHN